MLFNDRSGITERIHNETFFIIIINLGSSPLFKGLNVQQLIKYGEQKLKGVDFIEGLLSVRFSFLRYSVSFNSRADSADLQTVFTGTKAA